MYLHFQLPESSGTSLMTLCVVTDCSSSIHPGRIIIDIMTQENFSKSSEIVSPLLNYN